MLHLFGAIFTTKENGAYQFTDFYWAESATQAREKAMESLVSENDRETMRVTVAPVPSDFVKQPTELD